MNIARFIICLSLAAFVCGFGCTSSKPTPDPLVGFHPSSLGNLDNSKAITDDYKSYIKDQKLPPGSGSEYVAYILYFEDGTGQHAVQITISLNHAVWEHVLIYDKTDKRIKAIKYAAGHVSC